MAKISRKNRILLQHPTCCFCGGTRPATTLDHVPPKACFPLGYWPDTFEFPSCDRCNHGNTKNDSIFGFYSILLDFDEVKLTAAVDRERMHQLRSDIAKDWPGALPDPTSGRAISRVGHIITPSPMAVSVDSTAEAKEAMLAIADKLTHALYYREMGEIVTTSHYFLTSVYQPQREGTEVLTDYFCQLLPDCTVGGRSNIPKKYGDRFRYLSGRKPKEDFFVFAAQFGHGLICWGIVRGPGVEMARSNNLVRETAWRRGGCGLGNQAEVS